MGAKFSSYTINLKANAGNTIIAVVVYRYLQDSIPFTASKNKHLNGLTS